MLYQSTRNKLDTYTAHRVLHRELGIGEGQAVPLQMPVIPETELQDILSLPFIEAVSYILDIFFPGKITPWDISCAVGKIPARVDAIGSKFLMGVLWDNRTNSAEYLFTGLYNKLCDKDSGKPTLWARAAINIAVLFGLFSEMKRQGIEQADFATAACNMQTVFAAWYAKKMGLPVGTILCICNENSNCWDFISRGSINTGIQPVATTLPEMDVQIPVYLESLLFAAFGEDVVNDYIATVDSSKIFNLGEEQLQSVNDGMYACVVGSNRVGDVISSVSKTDRYALDPYAAAVYGGVQDYRAKTGKHNYTLVWANHRP